MAHIENQLISNIINEGDFTEIRKRNITADFFQTETGQVVFEWIWSEFHNSSHRREVPSRDRLARKFPDFPWSPCRDSIGTLINDIVYEKLRADLVTFVEDVDEQIEDDDNDPNLIVTQGLAKLRDIHAGSLQGDTGLSLSGSADALLQEYRTVQSAGGVTGVPFPYAPINLASQGMQPEDFIVIYGRPANYKTWLALWIGCYAYLYANARVFVFSKEMRQLTLSRRVMAMIAGVDYGRLSSGMLKDDEFDRYEDTALSLKQHELDSTVGGRRKFIGFFTDRNLRKGSTVDSIAVQAEQFDPDLIIVDGAYHLRDGRSNTKNVDWKNISHITQDLKSLAQSLQVPTIATVQANRAGSGGRGNDVDEIGYSDAFGQEADMAMRVFRGRCPETRKPAGLINFAKIREGKISPLLFNASLCEDFSLLSSKVNVSKFLEDKKAMEDEEAVRDGKKPSSAAATSTKKKPGRRKPKNPKARFRR